jgi:tetratricopeptide (TPR) repeat protein
VAAAAALLVASTIASSVGIWLIGRERDRTEAQRVLAIENFRQAREAVDRFFTRVSENTLLKQPGQQALRKQLLEDALAYYQRFLSKKADGPSFNDELGSAYYRVGKINALIGDKEKALESYQKAIEIFRALKKAMPDTPVFSDHLASCLDDMGIALREMGRHRESLEAEQEARDLYEPLARRNPRELRLQVGLAAIDNNLGLLLDWMGQPDKALACHLRSKEIRERLVREFPDDSENKGRLAATYVNLGVLHTNAGRPVEAIEAYEKVVELSRQPSKSEPTDIQLRRCLGVSYHGIAFLQSDRFNRKEASADAYRRALEVFEEMVKSNPAITDFQNRFALVCTDYASLLTELHRFDEVPRLREKAMSALDRLVRDNPNVAEFRIVRAGALVAMGVDHQVAGRPAEAIPQIRQGIAEERRLLSEFPASPQIRRLLGAAYTRLSIASCDLGLLEDVVATSKLQRELWAWDAVGLYNVACGLSLCMPIVGQEKDPIKGDAEARRRSIGDRAMEVLKESVAAGFKEVEHMKVDTDLDPLRDREDFRTLLRELSDAKN